MVVTEKMAMLEILEKRYNNTTLKLLFFRVDVNFGLIRLLPALFIEASMAQLV